MDKDMTAGQWNELYKVGTPVRFWPGSRVVDHPKVSRTRTPAWALGSGTPVVSVEGSSGGMALTHVEPITEEELEADQEPVSEDTELMDLTNPETTPKVTYEVRQTPLKDWAVWRVEDPGTERQIVLYDSQGAAEVIALNLNAWSHREPS